MQRGFTLIELMIAVLVMAVITTYLMDTFAMNQQAYAVVEQVSETQQNVRALANVVERDLRHAGFMVPASAAVCAVDNTNTSDILYVSDASAIDPTAVNGTSNGAGFAGNNVTPGLNNLSLNVVIDGDPSYDTDGDGTRDSDFQLGGGVIIVDSDNPERGAACGTVVLINPGAGTMRVDLESNPLGNPGSSGLMAIPAHEYRIDGAMVLRRDGMELTRDTEDLQVAFYVDLNDDNVEQVNEMLGDGIGPDYVNTQDMSEAREVRVNLVLRTRSQDNDFSDGQFQAFENRVAVAGNDGFRRRTYSTRELMRNLVMR